MSSIKNVRTSKLTVLTPFTQLLINKPPWGQYSASSWSGTTLTDLTGNGRNATISNLTNGSASGNGATASISYLAGSTTGTILWPAGSIPSTFTIASITRYATIGARGRILNGTTMNFLLGHWSSRRGVAFNDGFRQSINTGTLINWVGMVFTNGTNVANNVMVDGISITESTGGLGGSDLRINGPGACPESSEFEFSQLIIWNQALTSAEMNVVSTALNTYLTTGTLR